MTMPNLPRPIDPSPAASGQWTLRTDRSLIRAGGGSERFVLAELVAPTPSRDPAHRRPPVNLAFVIDRSGSMAGRGKLDLAKQGVLDALDRLEPTDRFSVVTYDQEIDIVVASTQASGEARRLAVSALAQIGPRGSTNLGEGWLRGAEEVASHLQAEDVNRVLLLTDGLANIGITDVTQLAGHAAQLRKRDVATSTIGVGEDFDETLLQQMADAGGGHFYFAGSLVEIRDHLTSEVGEALDVSVRGATLTATPPKGVSVSALTPHPCEEHGAVNILQLGDLVSGQVARVVVRLRFPSGAFGTDAALLFALADTDGVLAASGAFAPTGLSWRFVSDAESHGQPRDRIVDRAVAELFASRARQESVGLNRVDDWDGAARALISVARRIASYAGSDPELRAFVHELSFVETARMSAPMPEMSRKSMYFASSNLSRGRDATGKSRKQ
jgi:Ca-activated chloride channel family protein